MVLALSCCLPLATGSIYSSKKLPYYGERISTGFVESAVNQVIAKRFTKKQQMRWTRRGAHYISYKFA